MQKTPDSVNYSYRHILFGWWSLLVFVLLGLTLETLHGLKLGFYLDVSNTTRRLMWTLAHAHGGLLALIHVVTGLVFQAFPDRGRQTRRQVSRALIGASLLLPGGFFLGGISILAGDPGYGIALVPFGAACLIFAVFQLAKESRYKS